MNLEEKITRLLEKLTLEEKIRMIHGEGLFRTGAVERLGIPSLKMSDGPMGVRFEFQDREWVTCGQTEDLVSYCPSNSAIAATWNRKLAGQSGKVLGEEARGRGKDVILAPGINITRTPVCGRNFEYFSEDPYLISELAVPLVQGIEEADVAACVKHFALNNQEIERLWVNVEIEERALRELYLPAFHEVIKKGKAKTIMAAYNLFRGEHCCQNQALLRDILRTEWEYDGVVISDWGGVHDTRRAAESPLDIEMSVTNDFDEYYMADPLLKQVRAGEISEEVIDRKIRNILRLMVRLHMISLPEKAEAAIRDPKRKKGSYNSPEHHMALREVARESIVLLKNEEQLLPLKPEKVKRLLVIGDNAVRQHANGGGSAEIKALYEITPLMGLHMLLGGNCEIRYTPGYYVPGQEQTERNWQEISLESADKTEDQRSREWGKRQEELRQEAIELAGQYDTVIFVGGLNHEEDVEGHDRDSMELPYEQDRLILELLQVCPDMIIVMQAGNPVAMQKWSGQARALLYTSYCGMEGGAALAEVLFGEVNPSGKLPVSMPYCLEDSGVIALGEYPGRSLTEEETKQMQAHLTETYRDGIFVGYRYYEKYKIPVQYCFGYGLSYTRFRYGTVQNSENTVNGRRVICVEVPVTNTGARSGKETVQLYIGEKHVKEENAIRELKGFEKISIDPGETKRAVFHLSEEAFQHYDTERKQFRVYPGTYCIYIGSSLQDIKAMIEVTW